jgi:hypothetical protein
MTGERLEQCLGNLAGSVAPRMLARAIDRCAWCKPVRLLRVLLTTDLGPLESSETYSLHESPVPVTTCHRTEREE